MATVSYPRPWMTSARQNMKMSKTELAEIVGTTRSHIWAIEAGRRTPRPDLANRIANALNVDVGNFMPRNVQFEHDAVTQ